MKFGRRFKGALAQYPSKWGETAISYSYLKKVLCRVREELVARGYDPATVRLLVTNDAVEYKLEQDESRRYHPELSIRTDMVTDGCLGGKSNASVSVPRQMVEEIVLGTSGTRIHVDYQDRGDSASPGTCTPKWIRVNLNTDEQFFSLIREDVGKLGALQAEEQSLMNGEIVELRGEVTKLSRPHRFHKSDLNRWREVFDLYMQAQVFFSTREEDRRHSARTSEAAKDRMIWFQEQVASRELLNRFKIRTSVSAYSRFLSLNARLLRILEFQELNRTAVEKIIKKFEKQTALGVIDTFNSSLQPHRFMAENVAKGVCAELFDAVVCTVPRLFDYQCGVCWDLSFNPVRLSCHHLFCRQCVVTMQKRNQEFCPLCRTPNVMKATEDSVDEPLMAYMEKWFPKEAKGKQAEWEAYRRKEELGLDS